MSHNLIGPSLVLLLTRQTAKGGSLAGTSQLVGRLLGSTINHHESFCLH